LQVIANELGPTGPIWEWTNSLDFENMGFGIMFIILASWIVSVAVWKYKRLDQAHPQAISS